MRFLLFLLTYLTCSAAEFLSKEAGGTTVTVCLTDPKVDALTLHWKDPQGGPWLRLAKVAQAEKAAGRKVAMVMNAGMYHPDHAPVGLHVEAGKELVPLNTGDAAGNFFLKPNGVFFLANGKAGVWETQRYAKSPPLAQLASQSGPMLVVDGKLHPAFQQGSVNKNIRNGVGVRRDGMVCFAITDGLINLYDFASFFRDGLDCPDALYFDGSVSRLYAEKLGRTTQWQDLGPMLVLSEPIKK